jgi:hypothetical protein
MVSSWNHNRPNKAQFIPTAALVKGLKIAPAELDRLPGLVEEHPSCCGMFARDGFSVLAMPTDVLENFSSRFLRVAVPARTDKKTNAEHAEGGRHVCQCWTTV